MIADNFRQGVLNAVRLSATFPDAPELNISSSSIGKGGIALSFGEIVENIFNTQKVKVTIHLISCSELANKWKLRQELKTSVGKMAVVSDSTTLDPYILHRVKIVGNEPLKFNGTSADFIIFLEGYYFVNQSES